MLLMTDYFRNDVLVKRSYMLDALRNCLLLAMFTSLPDSWLDSRSDFAPMYTDIRRVIEVVNRTSDGLHEGFCRRRNGSSDWRLQ